MCENETSKRFIEAIQKNIDYFRDEYNLSYVTAIGCLHFSADLLSIEASDIAKDMEDKDNEENEEQE